MLRVIAVATRAISLVTAKLHIAVLKGIVRVSAKEKALANEAITAADRRVERAKAELIEARAAATQSVQDYRDAVRAHNNVISAANAEADFHLSGAVVR